MTVSLTDILTSVKNIPTGLGALTSAWRRGQGNLTSVVITATTTVATKSGRLVSFSVVIAGSAAGTINNSATEATAATDNVLCVTPMTVGITTVGMEFNAGLTVVPGSGQSVVVTYYQGP